MNFLTNIYVYIAPATNGFPDNLAPSYVKLSDWYSREPAYTRFFTRFFPPVTANKLRALKKLLISCLE